MIPHNKNPTIKPENLEIKMGTHEEVIWSKVRDEASALIKTSKDNLIIQKAMLVLALENIEIEKIKFAETNKELNK